LTKIGENEKKLLKAASRALKKAYVLWGYNVGAAVLAEDGKVYDGCNIESKVSGLGTCAERCAINHAVLHGNRKIKEVTVVMNVDSKNKPRPCGVCLQYIIDFAESPKLKVVMAKAKNGRVLFESVEVRTIGELLPFRYKK